MTTPTPSQPFLFPPDYSFPPFFTRQTNLTTHHAQLTKWASLVLAYCHHHRIFKLSLSGRTGTTGTTTTTTPNDTTPPGDSTNNGTRDTTPLFHNRRLNRGLSHADIREVIDFLRRDGRAEYVLPSSSSGNNSTTTNATSSVSLLPLGGSATDGGGGGDMAWIYWRTPEEWGSLVEGWVESTGQRGSVLTVYELVEGDGTRGSEFHGMDQELLRKALNVLVKQGKAQVFGQEDSLGVKFF
ncbi:ESCRT-II complex subunit [Chaetomium fimeti]|uniref:ESCRT-II complex subunit VPS25 n=1 Tax=Chaetomium fimeti TaxID=1854472 RepID=A0AAE0HA29_9PEZI|nr:ESCRT-II complex subunit [Chaetomium fimeti]